MRLPLCLTLVVGLASSASAATWSDRGAGLDPQAAEGRPVAFRVFDLQGTELVNALLEAPQESAEILATGAEISLPLPDGRLQRFRAWEAPLLGPALRLRHPEIHAYEAVGVDHSEISARIDVTALGVRAIILTPEGTAYLDPLVRGRTDALMSYWARDVREDGAFECRVMDRAMPATSSRPQASLGGQLRTLRLVLLGTGEYTQYLGGVSGALSEMVTSINRVNAIFERDLSVRFQAVGLTPFPDPATDPFPGLVDLDLTQTVVDSIYGHDGYDIAQTESQGGTYPEHAGVSYLPAVCFDWKAGSSVSAGDVHANDVMIKVMSHELGHTLGARHVGDTSCQADPVSSVEPGSGCSIMGRAGKCGPYDVTPAPGDLFFNTISMEQMSDTLTEEVPSCGTSTANGNAPPTAEAGPDYTIPRGTPFLLTGTGSDPDAMDVLTYSWDEHDITAALFDTIAGPIFRYRAPTTSPTRYLPAFGTVLADTVNRWERLPSIDRLIHFRFVVRDNHPGGGGQAWDEMTVTVNGAPFSLTYPQGGETVTSGPFTVTWSVGGGSVATAVNIDLSTDGGTTWTSLASNVPNNGSASVSTFSATTLSSCRVRVSAVGNIFYAVSRSNFTIQGGATDAGPPGRVFALRLLGANPARGRARFEVQLPQDESVDLSVYTVSGRRVQTLASGPRSAGRYEIEWKGTVAGVYVARLTAGAERKESRFILLR